MLSNLLPLDPDELPEVSLDDPDELPEEPDDPDELPEESLDDPDELLDELDELFVGCDPFLKSPIYPYTLTAGKSAWDGLTTTEFRIAVHAVEFLVFTFCRH